MKKNKGITLIALVVTIIVLLILAGISINMLTGQNGILKRATEAKKNTEDSSDLEYLRVEATSELIDYYQGNDSKNEDEYILEKWSKSSNSKISVNKTDKTVTYNGKTYAMSDIIGNESEKNKINENNMNQIKISTATEKEDKEILAGGKVRVIVEENNNMRAYIPNGFYYVSGKPSNGMVISDIYGDDDNNTKGGNQFVWVPCSDDIGATKSDTNGTEVTYEKVNGLAKTWKENYVGKQHYYTKDDAGKDISDWKDDGGDIDSVKRYKGFYIARYEAGLPTNDKLWSWKNNAEYGWTNEQIAGSLDGDRNTNIDTMIPVSKKNNASWNKISQEQAINVSKKMYEGSQVVSCGLVDSYAWDTILTWYSKTGIDSNSSRDYGNYYDTKFGKLTDKNVLSLKNALYAIHTYNTSVGVEKVDTKYHLTNQDLSADEIYPKKEEKDKIRTIYEIATGSSEYTKKNNIYDLAGNMWEWTTEVGNHSETQNDQNNENKSRSGFAVIRGGGFPLEGNNYPISYRHGNFGAGSCILYIGFRVAIYIKI